jgi:hypothetical protein
MTKVFIIAAAVAALAACTTTRTATAPVVYTVVEEDASIPFASKSIRNFRVGAAHTLLLEANSGKWYRATLDGACRSSLPWEHAIGIDAGVIDRFDRFSTVIIDGRRCQVRTLDRIADPVGTPAEAAPPGAS